MKQICLQAGHQNITVNCDPALKGGTGAPGEIEFTTRIVPRLQQILQSKKNPDGTQAFNVKIVDANLNCDPNAGNTDYDLFLAIHYDADVYNDGGGLAGAPDPSVDSANAESKRIRDVFNQVYFPQAGISLHLERLNNNITFYYMWQFLSSKTPCVLIECGVGQNAHDRVILADTERVCNSLARAICQAFNVPFDAPIPPPLPPVPPTPPVDKLSALRTIIYSEWRWIGANNWAYRLRQLKKILET